MGTAFCLKRRDIANQVSQTVCRAVICLDRPHVLVSKLSCAKSVVGESLRSHSGCQRRSSDCGYSSCPADLLGMETCSLVVCCVLVQLVVPHCRRRSLKIVLLASARRVACQTPSFVVEVVVGGAAGRSRAVATG